MGRAPCCEKVGLKRGRWTAEEDQILSKYIQANGEGSWRSLPKNAGLLRCGKSCRLRWINYLRSDLKRGNITAQEEQLIVKLHATFGNRWSLIAAQLPGRTDNEIKNYWNSHLSRKIYSFRNDITSPQAHVVMDAAAQPNKKRRLGRTSRAAMKKNKEYRLTTTKKFLHAPKQPQTNEVVAAVQVQIMPTTPTLEKEALTSVMSWAEDDISSMLTEPYFIDNAGSSCVADHDQALEYNNEKCFDKIMVEREVKDANGMLSFNDKEENYGVVGEKETTFGFGTNMEEEICNWVESEINQESWNIGPSSSAQIESVGAYSPSVGKNEIDWGDWKNMMESAAEDHSTSTGDGILSWLWDNDDCHQQLGIEMDDEKQNEMLASLLTN